MATVSSFFLLLSLISITAHASPYQTNHHHRSLQQSTAANGSGAGEQLWCVAKNNAEDAALQSALDWACGSGGANCGPIQQGGPCYVATDIQRTASYAFNDYFLKHGMTEDSCNFSNTAALTSLDPSHNKCKFGSSLMAENGNGNFTGSSSSSSTDQGLGGPVIAGTSSGNLIGVRWPFPALILLIPLILWTNFLGF